MICKKLKQETLTGEMSVVLVSSADEIPSSDWDVLTRDKPFMGRAYLGALEEAELAGFSFRHALLYKGTTAVAAFTFQLIDLSSKQAGGIVNMRQYGRVMQVVAGGINDLLLKGKKYKGNYLLVNGSMLVTGNHGIGCRPQDFSLAVKKLPAILDLIESQTDKQKGRIVTTLVKDFYDDERNESAILEKKGFHQLIIDPTMKFRVRPEWKTFDDYQHALSSKYRLRVRNATEAMHHVRIKELNASEIRQQAGEIEQLYNQVVANAPVLIVRAGISFFLAMKKKLGEQYRFRAFYENGRMIAFTTGYYFSGRLETHFIGIDYERNRDLQCYQNILYDFIRCAIERGMTEVIYGRTAIEIKSTVGAEAYPLVSYLKIHASLLHRVVGVVLPYFSNDSLVIRQPFKEHNDAQNKNRSK